MQIFLDLSCLVLIFVTIMVFWKRGFIRNLFGIVRIVLTLILTYVFGDAFSAWLNEKFIGDGIEAFLSDSIGKALEATAEKTLTTQSLVELIPEWLTNLLNTMGIDMTEVISSLNLEATTEEMTSSLSAGAAGPLSDVISKCIGYSVLFIAISIALRLLQLCLKGITKLPGVHFLDQAMGLVWGIAMAAVFVSAYTLLVYYGFTMWEGQHPEVAFQEAYKTSLIFKWLYEQNLFRILLGI